MKKPTGFRLFDFDKYRREETHRDRALHHPAPLIKVDLIMDLLHLIHIPMLVSN